MAILAALIAAQAACAAGAAPVPPSASPATAGASSAAAPPPAPAGAPSQDSLNAWLMASVPGFNRTITCQNALSLQQCLNLLADQVGARAATGCARP